ncbi:MAG: hypothetical protein Q7U20_00420 [Caulobacter sp.]|nr:hypothetical protein [Caulobacter sp.]
MQPPDKPEPPKTAKGPGFGARRGKRPLKHLKAMRGDGVLRVAGRDTTVGYQLDLYADGDRTIGSGSLDGDFTGLAEGLEGGAAQLTLADGSRMKITLENVEDDGAEFEIEASDA